MKRDTIRVHPLRSSFLSHQKDLETIIKKLFIESDPFSTELKKLLVIPNKDVLTNKKYDEIIKDYDIATLIDEGYVNTTPRVKWEQFDEFKTIMFITTDHYVTNATNPHFRDCIVSIDIVGQADCWDIGDYQIRPLKIMGIVDGLLNNTKLSGIGTFQFLSCNMDVFSGNLCGYTIQFAAVHGCDDKIEDDE